MLGSLFNLQGEAPCLAVCLIDSARQYAWQFVQSTGRGSMLGSLFDRQCEAVCLAVCSIYSVRQHAWQFVLSTG